MASLLKCPVPCPSSLPQHESQHIWVPPCIMRHLRTGRLCVATDCIVLRVLQHYVPDGSSLSTDARDMSPPSNLITTRLQPRAEPSASLSITMSDPHAHQTHFLELPSSSFPGAHVYTHAAERLARRPCSQLPAHSDKQQSAALDFLIIRLFGTLSDASTCTAPTGLLLCTASWH